MAEKHSLNRPLFPSPADEYDQNIGESLFPSGALSKSTVRSGNVQLVKCSSYQPVSAAGQGDHEVCLQDAFADSGKRKWEVSSSSDELQSSCPDSGDSDVWSHTKHGKRKKTKKEKKKKKKKGKKKRKTKSLSLLKPENHYLQECTLRELIQLSANAPRTVWLEEAGMPPELAYRIDEKGDRGHLAYGSIYRRDIATYRRRFCQICLGLSGEVRVNLSETSCQSSVEQVVLKSSSGRYFGKDVLKEIQRPAVECLPVAKSWKDDSLLFLALDGNEDVGGTTEESVEKPASRQLSEFSQLTQNYNKRLREEPNNVLLWLDFVDFQDKASSLGGLVEEDTGLGSSSNQSHHRSTTTMARQLRKISILEQALAHNSDSTELLIRHLTVCEDVWDEEKLAQRWKALLHAHPASLALWRHRLLFVRQRLSRFSFRKASNQFTRCLLQIASISRGQIKSHAAEPGTSEFLIEVLLAYCNFLQECGYTERAISIFQAAIEFNLFCPPALDHMSCDHQAAFFETFWDSGATRFGESRAKGWRVWMNEQGGDTPCGHVVDLPIGLGCESGAKNPLKSEADEDKNGEDEEEERLVGSAVSRASAWLQLELWREEHHWLPWRSAEECDDPDRCVLVDDVSAALFHVETKELQLQLVLAFLHFLGVKVPLRCCSSESLLKNRLSVSLKSASQLSCFGQGMTALEGYWMLSGCGLGCAPFTSSSTFSECLLSNSKLCSLIDGVFRQALLCFSAGVQTRFCVVWLCHQAELCGLDVMRADNPKSRVLSKPQRSHLKQVRHFAKALLKMPQNRTNVPLWELFARIEWLSGNLHEARTVLDKVLSLSGGLSSTESDDLNAELCSLYRTYAEMEAGLWYNVSLVTEHQGQPTDSGFGRCLHILNCLSSGITFRGCPNTELSPTQLLRARQGFASLRQTQLSSFSSAVSCNELSEVDSRAVCLVNVAAMHGLFECLVHGVAAARMVFNGYVADLDKLCEKQVIHRQQCRWACEFVLTACVRLVLWYSSHHQVTPASVKVELLQQALSLFPDNAEWHLAYSRLHIQSHLTAQIRRFLDCTLLPSSSLALTWLIAVKVENDRRKWLQDSSTLGDSPAESGITHRIRSLLERAVNGRSREEVLLWRQYAQFELDLCQPHRAWTVFLRAIEACPWAKVLYIDCIRAFPDQLEEMLDILNEKEIRVRAPLEEVDILREALASPENGQEGRESKMASAEEIGSD